MEFQTETEASVPDTDTHLSVSTETRTPNQVQGRQPFCLHADYWREQFINHQL